jgi:integrase/recombinase XerD
MHQHLDRFLQSAVFESGLSEKTLEAYASDLRRYLDSCLAAGIEDLAAVTREDIMAHLTALRDTGLSPRSVARHLSSIRRFHRCVPPTPHRVLIPPGWSGDCRAA